MQIILTQDVEHLGRAGEIVKVRPGYARNYLLPRGLAIQATRGNMAQVEHHRRAIEREQARLRAALQEKASQLEGASVAIARKVGQEGKLFGSVTPKDIVEALAAQNIEVDRKFIVLEEPIRKTGTYEVQVRFSADIQVPLKVNVVGV